MPGREFDSVYIIKQKETGLRHCRNQDCKLHSIQEEPYCLLREVYLDNEGKCEKFIKKEK